MKAHGFSVTRLLGAYPDSTLGFGSEFRTVEELEPLLHHHPSFPALKDLLENGMPYVFSREINDATKQEEVKALLERGNHKSASEKTERVRLLLEKDLLHGFSIPLLVRTVSQIPGSAVQSLGLAKQWTVQPDGTRTTKFRLTQDLSFTSNKGGPSRAINDRVDMGAYAEMVYGWCLIRILHFIIALRTYHPGVSILISKYDYSDAYRRMAHSATAAAQTIAILAETAYLSLRLTFGGSPNPPTWCLFSECVTDVANELCQCQVWDPLTTFSPTQATVPVPLREAESLGTTRPSQVDGGNCAVHGRGEGRRFYRRPNKRFL